VESRRHGGRKGCQGWLGGCDGAEWERLPQLRPQPPQLQAEKQGRVPIALHHMVLDQHNINKDRGQWVGQRAMGCTPPPNTARKVAFSTISRGEK
jgi:hypothetical protein